MKKQVRSFILLSSVVLLVILVMGFSTSIAFPSSSSECGNSGCHDTSTITVTSNATGTFNATVGTPFILNIDAAGYTEGDLSFYVSIESAWANNDQFTFTTTSIQDNGAGDLDSDSNEISISVDFTPISAGTHTLRIWAAGKNDVAGSLDVTVSAQYDANAPIIDTPIDIEYEYQDTGSEIIWNATDPNPVNYTIFRNGVLVGSGGWNGSTISIVVDWLIPGTYEYILTVTNIGGFSASDTVIVTVTLTSTTTTTTTTTTDTTTDTSSIPTTSAPPTGPLIHPAVVEPLSLVVGTWVGIIIVVLLISEILIRKGKW
ncbi:MAG: hypothetical protein ACTSSE_04920 [Candidatus Thorarchaeota archaeon]